MPLCPICSQTSFFPLVEEEEPGSTAGNSRAGTGMCLSWCQQQKSYWFMWKEFLWAGSNSKHWGCQYMVWRRQWEQSLAISVWSIPASLVCAAVNSCGCFDLVQKYLVASGLDGATVVGKKTSFGMNAIQAVKSAWSVLALRKFFAGKKKPIIL